MGLKTLSQIPQEAEILLYKSADASIKIDVLYRGETIWLIQERMSALFCVQRPAITKHLKNIYENNELDQESTSSILEHVGETGQKYPTQYYSLDAIIAVGYRVNSKQATQFRIWATQTLKEFIIKGFVLDDERLKQCKHIFGQDYFEELLERVRSIRTSERRIYQKITDIFAEISIDYDAQSELAKNFYTMVQNKFYFAITGRTTSEIIDDKANRNALNMGLVSWKNSPEGRILPSDASFQKQLLTM